MMKVEGRRKQSKGKGVRTERKVERKALEGDKGRKEGKRREGN